MPTFQQAQNVWKLNSQISQDGTFVHYLFFVLNILLFTLFTFSYQNFFLLFVCFDILWQPAMTHTRDNTPDRDPNSLRQNDAKMMRFFAGETSRALALLLAFAAENIKNLLLALHTREKIWAWLVSKSIFDSKLRSPQRLIKGSFEVCNLLFVYAVTL